MSPTLITRLYEGANSQSPGNALFREAAEALQEQNAMLVTKAPYPSCSHPLKCIPGGRCARTVNGESWNCAD